MYTSTRKNSSQLKSHTLISVFDLFSMRSNIRMANYQRATSWTSAPLDELFYHVREADKNNKIHPLNSIMWVTNPDKENELICGDGQQRMTSISLYLLTLSQIAKFEIELTNSSNNSFELLELIYPSTLGKTGLLGNRNLEGDFIPKLSLIESLTSEKTDESIFENREDYESFMELLSDGNPCLNEKYIEIFNVASSGEFKVIHEAYSKIRSPKSPVERLCKNWSYLVSKLTPKVKTPHDFVDLAESFLFGCELSVDEYEKMEDMKQSFNARNSKTEPVSESEKTKPGLSSCFSEDKGQELMQIMATCDSSRDFNNKLFDKAGFGRCGDSHEPFQYGHENVTYAFLTVLHSRGFIDTTMDKESKIIVSGALSDGKFTEEEIVHLYLRAIRIVRYSLFSTNESMFKSREGFHSGFYKTFGAITPKSLPIQILLDNAFKDSDEDLLEAGKIISNWLIHEAFSEEQNEKYSKTKIMRYLLESDSPLRKEFVTPEKIDNSIYKKFGSSLKSRLEIAETLQELEFPEDGSEFFQNFKNMVGVLISIKENIEYIPKFAKRSRGSIIPYASRVIEIADRYGFSRSGYRRRLGSVALTDEKFPTRVYGSCNNSILYLRVIQNNASKAIRIWNGDFTEHVEDIEEISPSKIDELTTKRAKNIANMINTRAINEVDTLSQLTEKYSEGSVLRYSTGSFIVEFTIAGKTELLYKGSIVNTIEDLPLGNYLANLKDGIDSFITDDLTPEKTLLDLPELLEVEI